MKTSRHYPVSFSKVSNLKDDKSYVQNEERVNDELQKFIIDKEKVSKTYDADRQYYSNTSE